MKRKIQSLKSLLLFMTGIAAAYSSPAQVSVTSSGGTPVPTTYTTVSSAFAAINLGTHTGDIDIAITGNTTEPASVTALLASGGTAYYTRIFLHPSGGNWTINSAAAPTASRGIIELNGADFVTIDGDDPATPGVRNLTIQAAPVSTTGVTCVRLSSNSTTGADGANNDTVRNCIIIGSRVDGYSSTTNYAINMSNYSTTSMTTGAYASVNTSIENNEIKRALYGIYANGASATYPITGLLIRDNKIGSSTVLNDNIGTSGIWLANTSSLGGGTALIKNNDIAAGGQPGHIYAANVAAVGINMGAGNTGCVIDGNNIHDIVQPYTTVNAYGINITIGTLNNDIVITNNFIRDVIGANNATSFTNTLQNFGIRIGAAVSGLIINHNTIALLYPNFTGTTANAASACLAVHASGASISEMQNNIFINNNPSVNAICVATTGNGNISGATVNNNNYYASNGGSVGYYASALRTTLSAWQTATGKDVNGISVNPIFTSPTNLHIAASSTNPNPLESAGAITTVNNDFDGNTRPGPVGSVNGGGTAPDIGADEFDGKPLFVNDVSATAFLAPNNGAFISTIGTFTPQATFSATGSATQTNVTVRYQIINSANTIIYNNTAVVPSLSLSSGPFSAYFSPVIITTVGTYTIKAIAELTGDQFTNNDTIVGTISVVPPLCGTYHVGVSQPAPFNTITTAINWLNIIGVSCPVEFLLDDAAYTQTDQLLFNQNIPGVSSTNTVTIRPNSNTNVTITASVPTYLSFIRILSNYIVIDGSNTTSGNTRNLTLVNTTGNSIALQIGSTGTTPVSGIAIKNCIIMNSVTMPAIIIADQTSASATGIAGYFNNVTIQNNDIRKAMYGVWAYAASGTGNGNGLLITGNIMTATGANSIRRMGLRVEGIDGLCTITNNEIANTETTTLEHKRGIYVGAGTRNAIVKGNTVYNIGQTNTGNGASAQGIATFTASTALNPTVATIDSNIVYNISSSASTTGFQDQTYGISIFGPVINSAITRNKITNIANANATGYAAYGINLESTADTSNILVANNFISDIKSQGSATLANNSHGIFIGDGSGYKIYHNSVNMFTTPQSGTEVSSAITFSAAVSNNGPAMDVRNNIFVNKGTTGTVYALYSDVASTDNAATFSNINYNDYYSAGSNLAYFSNSAQLDVLSMQLAFPGSNLNSINVNPIFTSTSDLHLSLISPNDQIGNAGTPLAIAGVSMDIDGDTRPQGIATDMGADEFMAFPLSMTLKNITASNVGNHNKIEWSSLAETEADHYLIERSLSGKEFEPLGKVSAKNKAGSYQFWDNNPFGGINYYRLKMYSLNGFYTYSKVVNATVPEKDEVMFIAYPNPLEQASLLTIQTMKSPSKDDQIIITDLLGKEVLRITVTAPIMTLNFSHLAAGTYLLNFMSGTSTQCTKLQIK